MIGMVFVA